MFKSFQPFLFFYFTFVSLSLSHLLVCSKVKNLNSFSVAFFIFFSKVLKSCLYSDLIVSFGFNYFNAITNKIREK